MSPVGDNGSSDGFLSSLDFAHSINLMDLRSKNKKRI